MLKGGSLWGWGKRYRVGFRPWERGRPARKASIARGAPSILALSHKGLAGVEVCDQNGSLAATALARVTLTLALSHKGRGDPLAAIRT